MVFVVGGPYGFSDEIYDRCQEKLHYQVHILSSNGSGIFVRATI